DRLPLLRRQCLERGAEYPLVLHPPDSLLGARGTINDLIRRIVVASLGRRGSPAAVAELVQDLPMGEPKKPGPKRPLADIEAGRAAPDREKDFLHQLFRGCAVEALRSQVKHQRGVSAV